MWLFQTSHGLTFLPNCSTSPFIIFIAVCSSWYSMNANLLEVFNYINIFSYVMYAYMFSPA